MSQVKDILNMKTITATLAILVTAVMAGNAQPVSSEPVGYVTVNSDTPSAFDEVAAVEVKLIGVTVGLTPTTAFPNTSVILTLCFTSVEVNGFALGVYAIVYAGPAVPRI